MFVFIFKLVFPLSKVCSEDILLLIVILETLMRCFINANKDHLHFSHLIHTLVNFKIYSTYYSKEVKEHPIPSYDYG